MAAASFNVHEPEPGAGSVAGVKVTETPPGTLAIEKLTGALKPPLTTTVRATLVLDPSVTDAELDAAVAR